MPDPCIRLPSCQRANVQQPGDSDLVELAIERGRILLGYLNVLNTVRDVCRRVLWLTLPNETTSQDAPCPDEPLQNRREHEHRHHAEQRNRGARKEEK